MWKVAFHFSFRTHIILDDMKWRNGCSNFDRNYLITFELFNAVQIAKIVVNRYYFFSQQSFHLMRLFFSLFLVWEVTKREEERLTKWKICFYFLSSDFNILVTAVNIILLYMHFWQIIWQILWQNVTSDIHPVTPSTLFITSIFQYCEVFCKLYITWISFQYLYFRKTQIKFFNTMHSFKQAVVLPWGIKKLKQPKSFDKMEEFVQKVIKSIYTFE